jgi:hypothetical protein
MSWLPAFLWSPGRACRALCRFARLVGCECRDGRLVLVLGFEVDTGGSLAPSSSHPYHPTYGGIIVATELTNGKRLRVTIAPVDANGNPASVEPGTVLWSASDPSILTVTSEPDETVALVRPVGPLGVANVLVEADADLGAGKTALTAEMEVAVVSGMATSLGLTAVVEDDAVVNPNPEATRQARPTTR